MGLIYDIDYDVARRDKARINEVIPILRNYINSIKNLQNSASKMKAETGNAIVIRSDDLIRSAESLIRSLELHNKLLDDVIDLYHNTDHGTAASIYKAGGGGYGSGGGGGGSYGGGAGGAGTR